MESRNTAECHGVSSVGTAASAELSVVVIYRRSQRTPGAVTSVGCIS